MALIRRVGFRVATSCRGSSVQQQHHETHRSATDWQKALGTDRPARGFRQHEYGVLWYPSREALLDSGPGPVLVGTSYQYGSPAYSTSLKQAKKYGSFPTHED